MENRVVWANRYAVFDEIASGGMATVYLAGRLGDVDRRGVVAVKKLFDAYAKQPDFVTMFLDEARMAARVKHVNVIKTYQVLRIPDSLAIVMEFVVGASLVELLNASRERKTLPPVRVTGAILAGALRGLHAAHEASDEMGQPLGIVHRDVSPHNVLVGKDGTPRVIDFGIAKAVGRLQVTDAGILKGKYAYMAPEQIRAIDVDRRTDVYAAAVVLWEMLTGRRLFEGSSDSAILAKRVSGEFLPPLPSELNPNVPSAADDVILKALSTHPRDRFASAEEMASAVEQSLGRASRAEVSAWVSDLAKARIKVLEEKYAAVERAYATGDLEELTNRVSVPGPNDPPSRRAVVFDVPDLDLPAPSSRSNPSLPPLSLPPLPTPEFVAQPRPELPPQSRLGAVDDEDDVPTSVRNDRFDLDVREGSAPRAQSQSVPPVRGSPSWSTAPPRGSNPGTGPDLSAPPSTRGSSPGTGPRLSSTLSTRGSNPGTGPKLASPLSTRGSNPGTGPDLASPLSTRGSNPGSGAGLAPSSSRSSAGSTSTSMPALPPSRGSTWSTPPPSRGGSGASLTPQGRTGPSSSAGIEAGPRSGRSSARRKIAPRDILDSRLARAAVGLGGVVLFVLALRSTTLLESMVVHAASERGLAMTVQRVTLRLGGLTAYGVSVGLPESDAVILRAPVVSAVLDWGTLEKVVVDGYSVEVRGGFDDVAHRFVTWAKQSHARLALEAKGGHVTWRDTVIPGMTLDVADVAATLLTGEEPDLRVTSERFVPSFGATSVGPWSTQLAFAPDETRVDFTLSRRGVSPAATVTILVRPTVGELLSVNIPRTKVSALGVPALIAGIATDSEVEAELEGQIFPAGEPVNARVRIGVHGSLEPLTARPGLRAARRDVTVEGAVSGPPSQPLKINKGSFVVDGVAAPLKGDVILERDGVRIVVDGPSGGVLFDSRGFTAR